jgi:dTDP-L-rhamnose 4-epimerase
VIYPDQRLSARLERGEWESMCDRCGDVLEPLWTDEAVVRPHNSYAMSKRAQEEVALALGKRYAIPTVAMRYSIVQGPRQSFRNAYSGALRTFAVRVLNGRPPIVYEDGRQLRDFVSIHDVVRANLLVLDDPRADYQAFNVGGARRVSVIELARMVIEQVGASLEPELPGLFRAGDTRHVFSDVTRLGALGWEPRVPQLDMVREYVAWASDQPDLEDRSAAAQERMVALGVLGAAHGAPRLAPTA